MMAANIRKIMVATAVCAALAVLPLRAGNVTINFVNGVLNETQTVPTHGVAAGDMAGMKVTVYFSDLSWEEAVWSHISGDVYGAQGTGWELSVDDSDTFYAPWVLTSTQNAKPIQKVEIDGGPGNTIFDVKKDDNPLHPAQSTPGSEHGRTLEVVDETSPFDITVTYSDLVQLQGSAPVGDVWRRMGLEFTNAGYFAPGSTMKFMADTDNVSPDVHVVPTPAEWSMLLMSLSVLSGYGFMKRRN